MGIVVLLSPINPRKEMLELAGLSSLPYQTPNPDLLLPPSSRFRPLPYVLSIYIMTSFLKMIPSILVLCRTIIRQADPNEYERTRL